MSASIAVRSNRRGPSGPPRRTLGSVAAWRRRTAMSSTPAACAAPPPAGAAAAHAWPRSSPSWSLQWIVHSSPRGAERTGRSRSVTRLLRESRHRCPGIARAAGSGSLRAWRSKPRATVRLRDHGAPRTSGDRDQPRGASRVRLRCGGARWSISGYKRDGEPFWPPLIAQPEMSARAWRIRLRARASDLLTLLKLRPGTRLRISL
jgi:hypothetical protein